jgi:cysteinyl-tRNA synthetase
MRPNSRLQLFDTLEQQYKTLPDDQEINIYVCGITPYDHCHIGHGRSMLVFDILHRVLRNVYSTVNFYQNITDIDDKIYNKCLIENKTATELTSIYIQSWQHLKQLLNILPAKSNPKVSECMPEIIAYIQSLIDKQLAYILKGDVYFDTQQFTHKYAKIHNFNALAGESLVAENKKNTHDFALWKQGKGDFTSPWSVGRPGWHIECSAMLYKCCSGPVHIHGGGCDLMFPHHSNEILQWYARFETQPANIWIHNGMLCINAVKMSKSLQNVSYLSEMVYDAYSADVFRYWIMCYAHDAILHVTEQALTNAAAALQNIRHYFFQNVYKKNIQPEKVILPFDLPELVQMINCCINSKQNAQVAFLLTELGFNMQPNTTLTTTQIEAYVIQRNMYRSEEQFQKADAIRQLLLDNFITLHDERIQSNGTTAYRTQWFYA